MDYYVVKNGDSIEGIANLYNVTPEEIIKANNLMPPYYLQVGQSIAIPLTNYDIFSYYTVTKNDTLYKIANQYNTTADLLAAVNGIKVDEYIYPNQVLLVPRPNVRFYITQTGDTIGRVASLFNTDASKVLSNNKDIYLLPDQLLVYRV